MAGQRLDRAAARTAGASAQLAALLWIAQWAHALVTHGPTSFNESRVWLGMTWVDSARLLGVAYLLLVPGVLYLLRQLGARGDRLGARAGAAGVAGLGVCAVTTVVEFHSSGWGTYEGAFDASNPLIQGAGITRAVTSAGLLTLAFAVLGFRARRARVLPSWLIPVLCLGSLATAFVGGPLPPVPGLAWLLFGAWLLTRADGPVPALTRA